MNYSSKMFLGDRPYDTYDEYLDDLKLYIMLLLRNYLIQSSGSAQQEDKKAENLTVPDYQEVKKLLDYGLKKKGIDDDQEISDWFHMMISRRNLTAELDIHFPLDELIARTGLEDFGILVLMLPLLGTMNRDYQRVFQYINRDVSEKHPNLDLCAELYYQGTASDRSKSQLIYSHSHMLQILYPELTAADNLMFCGINCDERLIDMILGQERYLTKGVSIMDNNEDIQPLFFREEELTRLSGFMKEREYPLFLICGDRGAGKKHLIRHFAKALGQSVAVLDLKAFSEQIGADMVSVMAGVRYAARECILRSTPLSVTGLELFNPQEQEQLAVFLNNIIKKEVPMIFLTVNAEHYTTGLEDLYVFELKGFTELQRIELWKHYTKAYELEEEFSLDALANTFIITPGQMTGAIRQASLLGENKKVLKEKLLYKACYAQLDHKLAEKTGRVNAAFTWEDLKVPDNDKIVLRDICNCVKNRHIVMNEWNFTKILPYGAGLTVLFSGPPGTGKTMAAQVIANELKMELYKIDLSQLFDKYIGETEKNIKQIFDLAKKSNSILFFDEADAIFNKRLEANNSNDRFANIESSLLLQCVEEYSGISILATNNFNSIDSAFIRRFKYYILFREPDEEVRYEIWKSVLPKEAPISEDVDLRLLAKQFQFTGAVIKNVVISSAYLAAAKGEAISLLDILISIKREMFKNNLVLTKDKLGSLGHMFEDIR